MCLPAQQATANEHAGWPGSGHWLGTGNPRKHESMPFDEALALTRSLGVCGKFEWLALSKSGRRPANMPSSPHATYRHDDWTGLAHWVHNATHRVQRHRPPK